MENRVPFYRKIFFSTTKYIVFKNVFLAATGVISIFIVRLLGPAEYGKYFLVIQIAATMGPILSLGWLPTLAKNLPEFSQDSQKKELFSNAAATIVIALIIFVSLFFFVGSAFYRFIPKEIWNMRYFFICLICLASLTNLTEGMFRGLGKFNNWALLEGTRGIISAALILYLIIFLRNDYSSAVRGNFIISSVFLLTIFSLLTRYLKIPDFHIRKEILNFASVMFAGQVLFLFISNVDPVLLRWLLKDPAQVGYYSAGTRIQKLTEGLFFGHLAVPFLYYFTENRISVGRKKIIENATRILGVIFGFVSLFLFSFSEQIILILFGKAFGSSVLVMRIFALWIFFVSLQVFVSPFFLSINRPYLVIAGGFIFFVFNFCFDLIFIPKFHAAGAALGAILAVLVQTFYYVYLYKKHDVNLIKDTIYFVIGISISVAVGIFSAYPVSLPVFLIFVILTKQITLKDFDTFKTVFLKHSDVKS
jgi:PST family polysaccharide transporter